MAAILKKKILKNKKEELKKKDAQSEQTIIFDEDITCLEYKTNHGAPIFHAATRDQNSDLMIKIFHPDGDLRGCIPCDEALIIQHIDTIKLKFRQGSIWSKKIERGLKVFDLITEIEPELVCDFIKIIYEAQCGKTPKTGSVFENNFFCNKTDISRVSERLFSVSIVILTFLT